MHPISKLNTVVIGCRRLAQQTGPPAIVDIYPLVDLCEGTDVYPLCLVYPAGNGHDRKRQCCAIAISNPDAAGPDPGDGDQDLPE